MVKKGGLGSLYFEDPSSKPIYAQNFIKTEWATWNGLGFWVSLLNYPVFFYKKNWIGLGLK
jgi:hypothetical protein